MIVCGLTAVKFPPNCKVSLVPFRLLLTVLDSEFKYWLNTFIKLSYNIIGELKADGKPNRMDH